MDSSTAKCYSSDRNSYPCCQGHLPHALTNWAVSPPPWHTVYVCMCVCVCVNTKVRLDAHQLVLCEQHINITLVLLSKPLRINLMASNTLYVCKLLPQTHQHGWRRTLHRSRNKVTQPDGFSFLPHLLDTWLFDKDIEMCFLIPNQLHSSQVIVLCEAVIIQHRPHLR